VRQVRARDSDAPVEAVSVSKSDFSAELR